jgi:nitrite reductase/ring-hydroxylating ferredoxin subunit
MRDETSLKKRLWTEEFSVHVSEDKYVLRRQFTKFLVLTSAGMLAGNVWIWLKSLFSAGAHASFPEQAVGFASQIPVGGVKIFDYPGPGDNCILVRTAEDKFVAYSQKCTHLSCAVYYSQRNNRLECPCHEGYFSIEDGRVLQGPPPRPLPRIHIEQRGDELVALRVLHGEEGR